MKKKNKRRLHSASSNERCSSDLWGFMMVDSCAHFCFCFFLNMLDIHTLSFKLFLNFSRFILIFSTNKELKFLITFHYSDMIEKAYQNNCKISIRERKLLMIYHIWISLVFSSLKLPQEPHYHQNKFCTTNFYLSGNVQVRCISK